MESKPYTKNSSILSYNPTGKIPIPVHLTHHKSLELLEP